MSREAGGTPAWSEVRAELEAEGVRPTKTLGQNFLFDPNLARAIVADAKLEAADRVLEVGPGCGFLTVPLAALGVELLCVEIDERLLRIARRRVSDRPNVRFLHADVLGGKRKLSEPVRAALWEAGDWHLVANLPYAIAGPLVAILAAAPNPPRSMTLLVQLEMAERFAAAPSTGEWGALSAKIQLRYRARLGREVGARMFWPRPRVRSRVVRLERQAREGLTDGLATRFGEVVEALFQRRRKTLRSGLSAFLGDRDVAESALERAGLDPAWRPENVDPEGFLRLAAALGELRA